MGNLISYEYKVNIKFVDKDNHEIPINTNYIEYIIMDHDYSNAITPTILLKLKLDSDVYNKMSESQNTGKVYLEINKTSNNTTSNVEESYINEQFDYIMTENPNPLKEFDKSVVLGESGKSFRSCCLGLIKRSLLDKNNKQFEGIIKNTNILALVQHGLSHIPDVIIEPPSQNDLVESITIPPTDSVAKFLNYVNSIHSIYTGQYTFYIDLKNTFMKSNSGKWIDTKDGQLPYIAIDVRDLTLYGDTVSAGMIVDEKQKSYIMYISADDVKITTDKVSQQVLSSIVSIDSEGKTDESTVGTVEEGDSNDGLDTEDHKENQSKKSSKIYINSDNQSTSTSTASSVENNLVILDLLKRDADASIFTLNKEYLITNMVGNNLYTGRYYITKKKDIFFNKGITFGYNVYLSLKMSVNYQHLKNSDGKNTSGGFYIKSGYDYEDEEEDDIEYDPGDLNIKHKSDSKETKNKTTTEKKPKKKKKEEKNKDNNEEEQYDIKD